MVRVTKSAKGLMELGERMEGGNGKAQAEAGSDLLGETAERRGQSQ